MLVTQMTRETVGDHEFWRLQDRFSGYPALDFFSLVYSMGRAPLAHCYCSLDSRVVTLHSKDHAAVFLLLYRFEVLK